MEDSKEETFQYFMEKYDIRCEICGKRSVEWDTWFNWQPCEDHRHLTPSEYKDLKEKNKA